MNDPLTPALSEQCNGLLTDCQSLHELIKLTVRRPVLRHHQSVQSLDLDGEGLAHRVAVSCLQVGGQVVPYVHCAASVSAGLISVCPEHIEAWDRDLGIQDVGRQVSFG